MKKIIAFAISVMMMLSLCVPAFAANITDQAPNAQTVIVKTNTVKDGGGSAETYTVEIPASPQAIDWGTTSFDITFKAYTQLLWYNGLKVTVAGTDKMSFTTTGLAANKTYELPYALTGATSFVQGPAVESTATEATKTLNVAIATEKWNAVPVAEYSDTLTFTAAVEDQRTATP